MDDHHEARDTDEGMTFAAATGALVGILFVLGVLLLYGIGDGTLFPVAHPVPTTIQETGDPA